MMCRDEVGGILGEGEGGDKRRREREAERYIIVGERSRGAVGTSRARGGGGERGEGGGEKRGKVERRVCVLCMYACTCVCAGSKWGVRKKRESNTYQARAGGAKLSLSETSRMSKAGKVRVGLPV